MARIPIDGWRGPLSVDVAKGVDEFQERVGCWNYFNFPKKVEAGDSNQPFKGMVEELGELAHADLKMQQGIRGDASEHTLKAKDAVGDLMVYLADYCTLRGWSMSECMAAAWNDIKDRDWRKFPKNGKTE